MVVYKTSQSVLYHGRLQAGEEGFLTDFLGCLRDFFQGLGAVDRVC